MDLILVTGVAGFIGSNFVLDWLAFNDEPVINLDALTYAGNLENLASLSADERHIFVQGNIGHTELVNSLLTKYQPRAVLNFAAESHVDRSIHGLEDFIQTNMVGTFKLLEEGRSYWQTLDSDAKQKFRFLYVSTDEVYGFWPQPNRHSPKNTNMSQTVLTQPVRRPVIIWCAPTITLMGCQSSPTIAPITMAPFTSQKNSSR